MATRRRRKRPNPLIDAAAEVRRRKVQFERDASYILSTALGFAVTVRIKPQTIAPPKTPPLHAGKKQRLALAGAFYAPTPELPDDSHAL